MDSIMGFYGSASYVQAQWLLDETPTWFYAPFGWATDLISLITKSSFMLNVFSFLSRYLQLFRIPYRFPYRSEKNFFVPCVKIGKIQGWAVRILVVTNRENIRFKTYVEMLNEARYVLVSHTQREEMDHKRSEIRHLMHA